MVSVIRGLAAVIGAGLFATSVLAQPCTLGPAAQRVFAANSSNNRIYAIDPAFTCTVPVTTATNQRKSINGIAVLDDGAGGIHLIAADTTAGQVLFYERASGSGVPISSASNGGPALPDGVSVNRAGEVFLVNAGPGGAGFKDAELWKIPRENGAYQPPVQIDPNPMTMGTIEDIDSDLLEDTEVVPDRAFADELASGPLALGDVVVLSRTPARVFRHRPGEKLETLIFDAADVGGPKFPPGAEPTGLAFAPDGSLLVVDLGGTVLRFGRTGTGNFSSPATFAGPLGNGKFRIAVGFQNGQAIAALTNRNGGSVIRIPFSADGLTGIPEEEVSVGVQSPVGVDLASSANLAAFTADKEVFPTNVIGLTFELPDGDGGVVSARVLVFSEPSARGDGDPLYLCDPDGVNNPDPSVFVCSTPGGAVSLDLGLPGVIPPHVQPVRKLGQKKKDPAIDLQFVLIELAASVDFDLVTLHGIEEVVLDGAPDCHTAPVNDQPRFFHFPDDPEDPFFIGTVYNDVSTACGSNIGRGNKFSTFLIARDTRSVRAILEEKFDELETAVGLFPAFDDLGLIASAEANATKGKRQRNQAKADLETFIDEARDFAEAVDPEAFQLVVRAESIIFFIDLL